MALYLECRINKNALLQTFLLAILPTGLHLRLQPTNLLGDRKMGNYYFTYQ